MFSIARSGPWSLLNIPILLNVDFSCCLHRPFMTVIKGSVDSGDRLVLVMGVNVQWVYILG